MITILNNKSNALPKRETTSMTNENNANLYTGKNLSVAELQMFLNRPDMCVC